MAKRFETLRRRLRLLQNILASIFGVEPEDGDGISGCLARQAVRTGGTGHGGTRTFLLPLCRDQIDLSSSPGTASVTSYGKSRLGSLAQNHMANEAGADDKRRGGTQGKHGNR